MNPTATDKPVEPVDNQPAASITEKVERRESVSMVLGTPDPDDEATE